jgi:D-tyrosyl-tRNA(Tyr) deacylase
VVTVEDAHHGFGSATTAGCAEDIGSTTGGEAWARRMTDVLVVETMQQVVDVGGGV